jgi:hypothetical protein
VGLSDSFLPRTMREETFELIAKAAVKGIRYIRVLGVAYTNQSTSTRPVARAASLSYKTSCSGCHQYPTQGALMQSVNADLRDQLCRFAAVPVWLSCVAGLRVMPLLIRASPSSVLTICSFKLRYPSYTPTSFGLPVSLSQMS